MARTLHISPVAWPSRVHHARAQPYLLIFVVVIGLRRRTSGGGSECWPRVALRGRLQSACSCRLLLRCGVAALTRPKPLQAVEYARHADRMLLLGGLKDGAWTALAIGVEF